MATIATTEAETKVELDGFGGEEMGPCVSAGAERRTDAEMLEGIFKTLKSEGWRARYGSADRWKLVGYVEDAIIDKGKRVEDVAYVVVGADDLMKAFGGSQYLGEGGRWSNSYACFIANVPDQGYEARLYGALEASGLQYRVQRSEYDRVGPMRVYVGPKFSAAERALNRDRAHAAERVEAEVKRYKNARQELMEYYAEMAREAYDGDFDVLVLKQRRESSYVNSVRYTERQLREACERANLSADEIIANCRASNA